MATDMTVALTIKAQLGARTLAMLGAYNLVGDNNFLMFAIKGSKAYNKIKITLTPNDLYTIDFYKLGKIDIKAQHQIEDVFVDQLHELIEKHTGLLTH